MANLTLFTKTYLILIFSIFSSLVQAQQPDFFSSGDLLQQEIAFWLDDNNKVKHTPVMTPSLASFGDQVFKHCSSKAHNDDVVKVRLNWSLNNPIIVADIKTIFSNSAEEFGFSQHAKLLPIALKGYTVEIYGNTYLLSKIKGSVGDYKTVFEDSCYQLKKIYFELSSTLAHVKMSGQNSVGDEVEEVPVIYPANALSQGISGNIFAYSPVGDNDFAYACRSRSLNQIYKSYYKKMTTTKRHQCNTRYNKEFLPLPGYFLYPQAGLKEIPLIGVDLETNEADNYSRIGQEHTIEKDERQLTYKTPYVSAIRIFGRVVNKLKTERLNCGILSVDIKAVQSPNECRPYLD